jgi:hypothetical protein
LRASRFECDYNSAQSHDTHAILCAPRPISAPSCCQGTSCVCRASHRAMPSEGQPDTPKTLSLWSSPQVASMWPWKSRDPPGLSSSSPLGFQQILQLQQGAGALWGGRGKPGGRCCPPPNGRTVTNVERRLPQLSIGVSSPPDTPYAQGAILMVGESLGTRRWAVAPPCLSSSPVRPLPPLPLFALRLMYTSTQCSITSSPPPPSTPAHPHLKANSNDQFHSSLAGKESDGHHRMFEFPQLRLKFRGPF